MAVYDGENLLEVQNGIGVICVHFLPYRSLHILVKRYNEAMRSLLFLMSFLCGMMQIISAVTLIFQIQLNSSG